MKVTLESTDKIVNLVIGGYDVPARIWQGETESGIPCHAFITRVACHKDEDNRQFERELESRAAPRPEIPAYDLRLFVA